MKLLRKNLGTKRTKKRVNIKVGNVFLPALWGHSPDIWYVEMKKRKKAKNRKHDSFFRYIYAIPENTRTLLRLAERNNPKLRRMLLPVDMHSLEPIPGSFSNVKEWGESDLAFKARFKDGSEFFVGSKRRRLSFTMVKVVGIR